MKVPLIAVSVVIVCALATGYWVLWMPGRSGPTGLSAPDPHIKSLGEELQRDVGALALTIGPRHHGRAGSLARTVEYIEQRLRQSGITAQRWVYAALGTDFTNVVFEHRGVGRPDEIILVGAHYDSVPGSPGANDNGSGVAVLLALARQLEHEDLARTVRFVAFVNEELPYGKTDAQGSARYAAEARGRGENIVGMVSLETIGYYVSDPGSQRYPAPLSWFYPNTGDFVAFVADIQSRAWVTRAIAAFRRHAAIRSEGVAAPRLIADISRSDHSAFWAQGYPAFMLTDTAPFRYPHYHTASDTPDQLDYTRLAQVTIGVAAMLRELANDPL